MNRITTSISVLGMLYAAVVFATVFVSGDYLPGKSIDEADLNGLRAAACGQFCTQQGQAACDTNVTCRTTGQFGTGDCVDPGKACGHCTGPVDTVCGGPGLQTTLCQTFSGFCCTAPKRCVDIGSSCLCQGTSGGNIGISITCQETANDPSCAG
jgi:hypothetical protein